MYSIGKMYVNYFNDEKREDTEKVRYGRVSESFKVTGTDGKPLLQDGKPLYSYETWYARFVGKANNKMRDKPLAEGETIILTEWSCRNPYVEEKGRTYPYILIMNFEYVDK